MAAAAALPMRVMMVALMIVGVIVPVRMASTGESRSGHHCGALPPQERQTDEKQRGEARNLDSARGGIDRRGARAQQSCQHTDEPDRDGCLEKGGREAQADAAQQRSLRRQDIAVITPLPWPGPAAWNTPYRNPIPASVQKAAPSRFMADSAPVRPR
jgi:hypothetical protein